jgi:hypothetical protein
MGLQILSFGFAFWFGLYLLARDFSKKLLFDTGLGLIAYSLVLASDLLVQIPSSAPIKNFLLRIHWASLLFPALFWAGATTQLISSRNDAVRVSFERIWGWGLLPAAFLAAIGFTFTDMFWNISTQKPNPFGYMIFGFFSILPLLTGITVIPNQIREIKENPKGQRQATGIILLASLFFALGSGVVVLQLEWIPRYWAILAIGLDLEALGIAIAYLDAFDQGESLLPDFLRSFTVSALVAILFGGQIAFAIVISTGLTFSMMILLLVTISAAIATQVFSDPLQYMLDRVIFSRFPNLRKERADLRSVVTALPRTTQRSLANLSEAEFIRLTRRTLSHFGDLPKLAASPLNHLPSIEKRLHERGVESNTLERVAELKSLLAESIERLKPPVDEPFGTSDEWRFYNALYYPYVVGLRPYSRRAAYDNLDGPTSQVLNWFRTMVPERTLHNWQNAAAALIAKDLLEHKS